MYLLKGVLGLGDGFFHIAIAKRDATTERFDEAGTANAKAKECKTGIETNME